MNSIEPATVNKETSGSTLNGWLALPLTDLKEKEIIDFDPDRKAAMISNLLVVLCGDSDVNPVINTGTLYH